MRCAHGVRAGRQSYVSIKVILAAVV